MDAQTLLARRIARELRLGMLVNLGIGIPTLVANHVPEGMQVFFQSENGLIGTGPLPAEGMAHPTLTEAGGRPGCHHRLRGAPVLLQMGAHDPGGEASGEASGGAAGSVTSGR